MHWCENCKLLLSSAFLIERRSDVLQRFCRSPGSFRRSIRFAAVRSSRPWVRAASEPDPSDPEPEFLAELPGDVGAAHDTDDLSADLLLDDRSPWHEAETEPIIDHGKTPAGELS